MEPSSAWCVFIIAGLLLLMVQPPSSCWLTPAQWQQFLVRRQRNNPDSSLSLHYLPDKPPARSLSMAQASAQADRWGSMAERARASEHHGLCLGLDATNFAEAQAAGNAVVPQVVEWIARKLRGTYV